MAVDTVDFDVSRPAGKSGTYPIPLVKTTVAGFIGRTERGPVNEPVVVRSFADYNRRFGSHTGSIAVSHAVQDFFNHGGSEAVVVRVANRATRARIDVPAAEEWLRLQARHPGRQEILRVSIDYERVEDDPNRFNLVAQRLRSAGSSLIADQELYPLVSMDPADERFIVDAIEDSRLISLAGPLPRTRPNAMPPDHPGEAIKYIAMTRAGSDGDELTDYDIIGSNRESTGLFAFERGPRIDLLCIPLPMDRNLGMTALVAAERYCERHRAVLIWDPPLDWRTAIQAVNGARHAPCASRNVMTYFPRIRPRGERARFEHGMPACGAIAGMLAYHDKRGLWQPGSAVDFLLKSSLTGMLDLPPEAAALLERAGVNAFVRDGGQTRLTGNVTLGGAGLGSKLWRRLDQRRLSFFILNTIGDAAAVAARHFEPASLEQDLTAQIEGFLATLFERRALAGTTPHQAYCVSTHPRPGGAAGFALRFGFALHRPGDFAEYLIEIEPGQAGVLKPAPALEVEQLFS